MSIRTTAQLSGTVELESVTAVVTVTAQVPTLLVGADYQFESATASIAVTANAPTSRFENVHPPPAVIRTGSAQSISDDFNRGSLGANWTGFPGSAAIVANVLEVAAETNDSLSWIVSGYDEFLGNTELRFDFWVPPDLADGYHAYELDGDRLIYIENTDLGAWSIYSDGLSAYPLTVVADTWYTIKAHTEPRAGGAFKFKLWEQGDPEPDAWTVETTYPAVSDRWEPFIYIDALSGGTPSAYPSRMDNVSITLTGSAPAVTWQIPAVAAAVTVTPGVPTLEYVQQFELQFDVGGIGLWTQDLVFNSGDTVAQATFDLYFDVAGSTMFTQDFVFDVNGALAWTFDFVFDVNGTSTGVGTPTGTVSVGPVDTTVAEDSSAGDTTLVITSATNIVVGTLLLIGTEYHVVTSVTVGVVAGAVATTLAANADAGDTVISVTSATNIVVGTILKIGDEYVAVTAVNGTDITLATALNGSYLSGESVDGTAGTLVTFGSPLGVSYQAGTQVTSSAAAFLPVLMIADKQGTFLGAIPHASEQTGDGYTIADSPSRHMYLPGSSQAGSMSFYLPRTSPHSALLEVDRLVYMSTTAGTPAWAGPIVTIGYGAGQVNVECTDISALWGGPRSDFKQELSADTPGSTIFAAALDIMNARRTVDSELVWDSDLTVTNTYIGSIDYEDMQPSELFASIADRSDCEYSWSVDAAGGSLLATFVARDQFVSLSGGDIFDGTGGNVAANPLVDRTSDNMVHSIKLTGKQPDLFSGLNCFDWAVGDYTPEVTVEVDPGQFRRREQAEVSVDWGLSLSEQTELETGLRAQIDALYETFLYAHHDQEGRPYHEGWVYEGPPSDLEPILNTGEGWRTRRHIAYIAEDPGTHAGAVVMRNVALQQILAVTYHRQNGQQRVRRYWYSQAGITSARKMEINGYPRWWDEVGGVATTVHRAEHDHREALVSEPYRILWVREDANGRTLRSYHSVVRVIQMSVAGGGLQEGRLYEVAQPDGPWVGGDPPYQRFTFVAIDADEVDIDNSLITKIWDFERNRICDWDPRRDGVGVRTSRLTVRRNLPSTGLRWHKVAWTEGAEGTTTIVEGLGQAETVFPVENAFALPSPNGVPYDVIIEGGTLNEEVATVVRISGAIVTVIRGLAIVHEAGATISLKDPIEFTGLEVDFDWTQGTIYANRLLARLSKPFVRYRIQLVNTDGVWSSVQEGSVHNVTIETEGPVNENITGQVRVLGFAPSVQDGTMEIIVEPYLP